MQLDIEFSLHTKTQQPFKYLSLFYQGDVGTSFILAFLPTLVQVRPL